MDIQQVTFSLTYFASGTWACCKPAMTLDSAPTKKVLPQGWFKILNKPKETMSGKMNRLMKQEVRASYGDKAT